MSFLMPSSSERTCSTWPSVRSLIFFEVMMIGIGQNNPSVSSVTSDCIIDGSTISDEQIDAAGLGLGQIRRDAGELIDAFDERILADAHEPHRRRARDELDAEVLRRLHELGDARHAMLTHNALHHPGAEAPEMKP